MDNQNNVELKQSELSLEDYADIILRRKWLIIIPFILSLIITGLIYYKLPKIYRSDTLILVLPQTVPEDYVKPTITTPIVARLASITDEILSRTRLETIINELSLYPELRKTKTMEQIVTSMREDISLDIKGSNRGETASSFKIYYQGKNPETVMKVTKKLASLFIEENLKTREQQARLTTDFLDKELASAKEKLEEFENTLTEFKFKHLGNLPEQNEANLEMLRQLAGRRQMINESIARAENKENLIHQQLSETNQFLNEDEDLDEKESSLKAQLEAAKNTLTALKSTYTENHIEIIRIRELIRQLNDQLTSHGEGINKEASENSQTPNPLFLDLKTRLMITNKEIELLKEEKAGIEQQIAIYEKRIEEVPRVELQLASLTRDYNNTKQFYENLLHKKLAAEQAENLERKQQGEQFRILDPASLPKIPFKPNPNKIFFIGIFLGFATGFCLVFLTEMLDKSFKTIKDAEKYLGVPILAAIPFKKGRKT